MRLSGSFLASSDCPSNVDSHEGQQRAGNGRVEQGTAVHLCRGVPGMCTMSSDSKLCNVKPCKPSRIGLPLNLTP